MKNCEHNEIHLIEGEVNIDNLIWQPGVCVDCGQTLYQLKNESGMLYYTKPFVDEHGYKLWKLEPVIRKNNDKLWVAICETSTSSGLIGLPELRKILEKHKVLGDEKDGM